MPCFDTILTGFIIKTPVVMKTLLLLLTCLPISFAGYAAIPPDGGQTPPRRPTVSSGYKPFQQLPPKLLSQVPTWLSTGQVDVPVRDVEALLSQLPAGKLSGIGSLLSSGETEPRYVAVGGSLTAGYRNGGLYREAQLTAYPNLIARQMGLTNFRQPLFDLAQGNGSGYKQLVPGGSFPQYKDVVNNQAVTSNEPLTFAPFTGRVDNLGMPFLGVSTAYSSEEWRYNEALTSGIPYELAFRSYFRRLLPSNDQQWNTNYLTYAKAQASELCTIELGLDDLIWYASSGGYRLDGIIARIGTPEGNPISSLLAQLKMKGTKAIVCTVPDVLQFPYFRFFTVAQLKKRNGDRPLYVVDNDAYDIEPGNTNHVIEIADDALLLPTATIAALFDGKINAGLTKTTPLLSRDVLTKREIDLARFSGGLNDIIRWTAVQTNTPIVDLRSIYDQIINGNYVTHDGLKIDPSFPGGNFFSDDGLYPSTLGQAVIANEWIKVLNLHYKSNIPLIATRQFANVLPR